MDNFTLTKSLQGKGSALAVVLSKFMHIISAIFVEFLSRVMPMKAGVPVITKHCLVAEGADQADEE